MLRLTRFLAGYGRECFFAPLFKMLEAAFQLAVPLVMAAVVDRGIGGADRGFIMLCAAALVGMGVVGWACAAVAQYFSAKLASGFGTALRNSLFAHIMELSRPDVDELGTSTLITRLANDTNQIQDGVNLFFRLVLRCPIAILGSIAAAFAVDGLEGALFCVVAALVLVCVWLVMRVTVVRYRGVQQQLDGIQKASQEQLEGIRVLRAFTREDAELAEFDEKAAALRHEQVAVGDVAAFMNPLTYAAVNLGLLAVLFAGGARVGVGAFTQGELVALVNYMSQLLVELLKLTNLVNSLSKAEACAKRVNEVFDRKPSMVDGTLSADGIEGSIELRGVSFTYPGGSAPTLQNISLAVRPGQTLGVIGGTGSGKSTLASLLMRFYDPSSGEVLIGGRSAGSYEVTSLHEAVSLVDQRPRLFAGTIAENLRWACADASDDELMQALGAAQALDVASAKGGLSGEVEQLGRNLSGGQCQRLSIARTLVRRPRVLILDDASSALDLATDAALRHTLASEFAGSTKVIISQRVSALRHADLIAVLDQGRLAGLGTHKELLGSCEVYQEICASQNEEGKE